jgi:hypothetical protein
VSKPLILLQQVTDAILVATQLPSRHCIQLLHPPQLINGTLSPAESRLVSMQQPAQSAQLYFPSFPSAVSDNDAPANVNTLPTLTDWKPSDVKQKPSEWKTKIQMHSQIARLHHPSSRAKTAQSATPRADPLASAVLLQGITRPIQLRQCHYHLPTEWAASRVPAQVDLTALAKAAFLPMAA